MQIGKAARSNGSHIKSRLKMEPHGVFKEVTKQCTNKDHYQSVDCRLVLGSPHHLGVPWAGGTVDLHVGEPRG